MSCQSLFVQRIVAQCSLYCAECTDGVSFQQKRLESASKAVNAQIMIARDVTCSMSSAESRKGTTAVRVHLERQSGRLKTKDVDLTAT